jgi:DNA-binding NarL/FixJ family response regulator
VEAHVRNILAKLGYSTRTEIATWSLRGASQQGAPRSSATYQP